jgi:hypothetical protein
LCRSPLKKGDMPKLISKALAYLESTVDKDDVDILPESVREKHSLMQWHQARQKLCPSVLGDASFVIAACLHACMHARCWMPCRVTAGQRKGG